MVAFRTLDENGDMTFGKGLSDYSKRDKAISLDVRTRLLSWVGDCFFDQEAGIDWTNRLGSFNQRNALEQDLRRVILQTEGVTEIVSFSTSVVDRKFTASYTINTIYSKNFEDLIERSL